MANDQNSNGMSRRNFLKNSGLVAGGLVGGSLFGGLITSQFQKGTNDENVTGTPTTESFEARTFFSRNEDFDVLSAATERIYPEDENGPGAIELGVPYFIDRQCSNEWGMNANDYMSGPFPFIVTSERYEEKNAGTEGAIAMTEVTIPSSTPRYQTKMTRAVLFLEGVRAIDQVAKDEFGDRFIKLTEEQQDEILQKFDNGEADISGVNSSSFFSLLRKTTIEGVYADPVYGGNRNMEGWKMKEYPGPRMGYLNEIEEEEFIAMAPESLRNYQGH